MVGILRVPNSDSCWKHWTSQRRRLASSMSRCSRTQVMNAILMVSRVLRKGSFCLSLTCNHAGWLGSSMTHFERHTGHPATSSLLLFLSLPPLSSLTSLVIRAPIEHIVSMSSLSLPCHIQLCFACATNPYDVHVVPTFLIMIGFSL